MSPAETEKIVMTIFNEEDNTTLEKLTAAESFATFMTINDIVPVAKNFPKFFKKTGCSDKCTYQCHLHKRSDEYIK